MRDQARSAGWFAYRFVAWVDAYRVKVFSVLAFAGAVGSWLTGSGFLQLVAIASLIMVLVNLFRRAPRT